MRKLRTWALALVVVGALLTASDAPAGPGGCTDFPSLFPMGYEQITVSSTAVGFTAAAIQPAGARPADMAVVSVATNAIRSRDDGLNPSATVGFPFAASSTFTVCGAATIQRVKFIRQSADATLDVSYYRGGDQ